MKLAGAKSKPVKKDKVPRKKTKVSSKAKDLDVGDELVTASTASPKSDSDLKVESKHKEVKPVRAFEGGFVNPALREAVNAHWRRSSETALLVAAIQEALVVDGMFVGLVFTRPSFVRKQGGGVLF